MNQLSLGAEIVERSALRFTPAGLPALDLRLEHRSQVEEAGQRREVQASVRSVALGAIAERLMVAKLGSMIEFTGFIASPRNSKQLVFHIQDFKQIS